MNWHHQRTALTTFPSVYLQTSHKSPMPAKGPELGRKNPLELGQEKILERLECSALEFLILSAPCSQWPRECNNALFLDMGTLESGYLQFYSDWRKPRKTMVFKCTRWLKAQKQLASGQAMRMNNDTFEAEMMASSPSSCSYLTFWNDLNWDVVN